MHPLLGALSPCLLKRRHHGLARLGPRLSLRGTGRAATTTGWLTGLAGPAAHLVADVAGEPSIFRFVDD